MRVLLFPLLLFLAVLGSAPKPDAATMQQVRAIRRLTGSFLEMMGRTVGLVQNQQLNGQFPASVDFLRWAVKESSVFSCQTGKELDSKLASLSETLAGSTLFTSVFPRKTITEFFQEIAKNKAAYLNNFDASHLTRLEKGVDSWLTALSQSGNRRIFAVLLDLAKNTSYSDRAKSTNSLANFLALVIQSSKLQSPTAEESEWFNFVLAMRGLRRFVNRVLPTPTDVLSATRLFAFLGGLGEALRSDNPSSGLVSLGAQLTDDYPVFALVDYKFYATKVREVFLKTPRLTRQVQLYLTQFIQKHQSNKQKGADLLAFGVYYTWKSLVVTRKDMLTFGEGFSQPLVSMFLERLGLVVVPEGFHMTDSAADLLDGIAQRIQTFPPQKLLTTPIGIMLKRIARFIGVSPQSGFNDSMMTEITGIKNAEVDIGIAEQIYYDCQVHEQLREFFGDQDESKPTFGFAPFVLENYLKIQKIARSNHAEYLKQRKQISNFLGDLLGLGRDAVGAVLILISTRPDYITEARVLLRLSEFGLSVLDSKSFAQAVGSVKPALLGISHDEDDAILDDFMNTDEMLAYQEMSPDATSSYCSPDDANSGSDETGQSDDGSNSQSASEGTDSDPQSNIASSLLDLQTLK